MTSLLTPNPISRFAHGFSYPLRAFRFLNTHPALYRLVAIPFLVNLVVFTAVIYFGFGFIQGLLSHYLPAGEGWCWQILRYLLWALATLLSLGLVFFTFTTIGSLIAAPFNDLLSARTEEACIGAREAEPFRLARFLQEAKLTVVVETKKIFFFVAGMALLLFLHLLPGLGALLYGVCSLLWTILFLVVEYTGYVLTRNRFSFADQRRLIFSQAPILLGFGCSLFALLLIPLLQLFCIPLGVVGATLLLHEQNLTQNPELPERRS